MQILKATEVWIPSNSDIEYGEADLDFTWPDEMYGHDGLFISQDGHYSRRRQIQSGYGSPDFLEVDRDRIRIRFDQSLAKKLDLNEEVEIQFATLNDEDYANLLRVVAEISKRS